MSAESIARAVGRIRAGQYEAVADTYAGEQQDWDESLVVDVQALRDDVVALAEDPRYEGWWLYEDSVLRPPWANFVYGYEVKNVVVLVKMTYQERPDDGWPDDLIWQPDEVYGDRPAHLTKAPDHRIDWDQIEWIAYVGYYVGGGVPLSGPHHLEMVAIDGDGAPQDIRWVQVRNDVPMDMWSTAQVVWLKATTFLNCRNVTVVEPSRSKQRRKQLARAGCPEVTEISIFKAGRTVRGARGKPGDGVPLSTVRGHVAKYGPKYGRGLLFGKYEGEFWVPTYARGKGAPHEQRYTLLPNQEG